MDRSRRRRSRARSTAGATPARLALWLLALAAAAVAGWVLGLTAGRGAPAATRAGAAAGRPESPAGGRSGTSGRFEDLGPAPRYFLTDQEGRRVDSDSLLGKVQLVTFLFPYCRTYCPLVAAHLRGLEGELRSAGLADRVQFVAFNVDPAGAGPADLRAFLRQYGWDPSGRFMEYLTGSPAEIRRVVRDGYHIDYRRVEKTVEGQGRARSARLVEDSAGASDQLAPQPEVVNRLADSAGVTYDVVHNDALELVGPDGRIRRYYDEADRIRDERLLEDIRALLSGGER